MRLRALVAWSVGLGLGLGVTLGAGASYLTTPAPVSLSDDEVKERARNLGMRPLTELAGDEVVVAVGEGTTAEQLARTLQEAGLLANQSDLLFYVGGQMPKVGVYRFKPGQSLESLIKAFFPSLDMPSQ